MASLSPPFILCPLPDRKALVGIRSDRLQNKAVITLGKNIAIRYHVLEQKQESSWTTSRYWFTSPVTFCYDLGKYGAVLNHNIVALWDEGDSALDNFDKVKLPDTVHALQSNSDGRTVVIMKNGNVVYLSDLAESKRIVKKALLDPTEIIVGAEVDEKNNQAYFITAQSGSGNEPHKKLSIVTVSIDKENTKVISRSSFGDGENNILGFCLRISEAEASVVYLAGDGFVYMVKIEKDISEPTKFSNLTKFLSLQRSVIMCPLLHKSCIALYGCDAAEEGAMVLIYDIQYDLVVCKQPLKMYSAPPFMERIGQSLFGLHGMHVLVLNYKVSKPLLSSIVGKHQAKLDEEVFEGRNPWKTKGWDNIDVDESADFLDTEKTVEVGDILNSDEFKAIKTTYPNIWETIQQAKIFESEGQPEAIICNHIIPAALEKRNGEALDWILNTFLDIPEVHLVSMVVFSLGDVDVNSDQNVIVERLNRLLLRKFDKHLLTQSLRYVGYDDIKKLLLYIDRLVKDHWEIELNLDPVEESPIKCWLKWCSASIDAHYTKFVLHSDIKIIEDLLSSVNDCMNLMDNVADLEPYLLMTHSKQCFEPSTDVTQRWRTETVTFD